MLRDLPDPVVLWAADRADQVSASLTIEPVCRMAVDPRHWAAQLTYAGMEYHL